LRKKCNEIIAVLNESFAYCDKSAPEYVIKDPSAGRARKSGTENHVNYHIPHIKKVENFKGIEIQFDKSLEDPSIELELNEISKDENKKIKFNYFLEFYFQNNK